MLLAGKGQVEQPVYVSPLDVLDRVDEQAHFKGGGIVRTGSGRDGTENYPGEAEQQRGCGGRKRSVCGFMKPRAGHPLFSEVRHQTIFALDRSLMKRLSMSGSASPLQSMICLRASKGGRARL